MAGEASGSGGGGAASLVPLTECPICFLTYTRPLQLSCGHTLCASCVDGLVNQVRDPANRHMIEVDQMLNDLREEEDNAEQQRAAGNWPYQGDGQVGLGGQLVRLQQGLQQLPPPGVRNEGFIPIGGAAALANILEGRRANGNPIGVGGGVGQQRDRRLFGAGYELVGYGPARRNTGTTIKCPECRKPTHVPQDGLPVNYRLQELIEQVTAVEEAAEASRAAEAEAARNKLLLDPNKCNKCNEVITGDTIFSCANINCVDAEVLCSTCCIRYHNGHVIRETKALTEKDLLETKNRIGEQTGRAYDVIERIQLSVKKFSNHAFAVKHVLAKSVKSFEDIAGGLESLSENSLESLNLKEQKAVELADQFEKMLTKCGELSDGLKEHIDELVKEHEEYMRMNGYDIKNEVDETEDLGGGVDTDVAVTYQNNNGEAVVAAGGEAMDMDEAAVPPPPPVVLPAAGNEDPVARQLNLPQPLRVPRLIHQALRRHRGIVVPRVAPPPGPGAAAGGAGPNPAGAAPRPPALPPVPLPPALPPVPHPPALPPVPHPPALPAAPHPPALPAAAPAARPLPFNPLGVGPFNPALAAAIDYIQPAQRAMEILQQELHQRVDNGFNAQLRQQYQQMQHNHMQRQVANDQPLAGQAAANAVAEQAAAAVNYANQYNQQLQQQQRQQQQQPQQQLLAQQQQAMAQRVQQHVQQHMQQQQQVQQQIQHHQQQYAQHNQQLQQQLMRDQWRPYHPRPMDNQPQYQYQQPPLAPPQQQPQQQQQQQNAPIQGQQHFVLHRYHGRNQPDAGYIPVNQPQQQQPRQMQQQQQQQQARAQLANHLAQILHPPQEGAVRLRMGHEEGLRDGQDEEAPALFHNVEDDQYGGGLPIVPQGAEEQVNQANPEMLMGFNLAGAGINIHPLPAIEGENEEINGEEEENDGMNALNDHQYAALEIDRIEDDEGGNVRRRVEEEHQQVIDALGNITRDHTNEQVERLLNTERLLRMQRRALRMAHEPGMYLDIRREAERFLEYVRRPNNIREVRRDNVENVAEANLADEEENNEEEEEGMRDGEDGQVEGDGVGEILADADDAENQREDIQNLREQAERIHISPRRRVAGKAAEQVEQQENRRITRSRSQDADEDDNNGLYPIAGDHLSQGNGRPNKKRKADAKTEEIGGSITRRTRSATQLAVQDRPSTSKQPIMRNIAEEGEDEE